MRIIAVLLVIFLLSACSRHYSQQPRLFRLNANHVQENGKSIQQKTPATSQTAIAVESKFEKKILESHDTFSPISIVKHFKEHLSKTSLKSFSSQTRDSLFLVKQDNHQNDSLRREKALKNTGTITQFTVFGIMNALLVWGGIQVLPLFIVLGALMAFAFIFLIVQLSEGVFEIRDRERFSKVHTNTLRNNFLKVVVYGLLLILFAILFSLIGNVSFSFVPFIFASIFGTAGVIMLFIGLIGLLVTVAIPTY